MSGSFLITDIDTMLNTDEFADECSYTSKDGNTTAVFDGVLFEITAQGDIYRGGVEDYDISVYAKTSDVVSVEKYGLITINSIVYEAVNDQVPDGTGLSEIPVRRQEPINP